MKDKNIFSDSYNPLLRKELDNIILKERHKIIDYRRKNNLNTKDAVHLYLTKRGTEIMYKGDGPERDTEKNWKKIMFYFDKKSSKKVRSMICVFDKFQEFYIALLKE